MRLFHKLLLLLTAVAVVPLAVFAAAFAWRSAAEQRDLLARVSDTFQRTGRVGQASVSAQTWQAHLRLVEGKAQALETAFETIRRSDQMLGLLLRQALREADPRGQPPVYEGNDFAERLKRGDPEIVKAKAGAAPYAIYRLSPGASKEATAPALRKLAGLAEIFAHLQQKLPWCRSSYAWHRDGLLVGYPGGTPFSADYDPRDRTWLKKVIQKKRLVWTKMYRDKDGSVVMTYADPVWAPDGALLAAAGIDIRMNDLLAQLFDLRGLPIADAVLMDYKGRVRASAAYDAKGASRLLLDPLLGDYPPQVYDYLDGRYNAVFKAIRAHADRPSGVLSAEGRSLSEAPEDADLFAYARLKVNLNDGRTMDWYYVARTPAAPVFKPVDRMRDSFKALSAGLSSDIDSQARRRAAQIALAVTLMLLLSGALAYAGAHATSGPLLRIAETVSRLAGGDFSARLKVTSSDEIGQVQQAVNDMAQELERGLFAKNTFKRFVSPTVVERLLKDPALLRLGGERRVMTVLFSDIAGFTTLAEKMQPEALVELLNEYLSAMTLCVFAREGTLDKYEGDAMMAFWGAPLEQPDHADKACLAALDLQSALAALNGAWSRRGLPSLEMRVGVNTGPMVVGNIGSMIKMDYTALGDAVNLASRLEGANRAYGTKILAGEWTYRAAKDAVEAREIDLITVKGRGDAERVYEILAPAGGLSSARAAGRDAYARALAAYRARRWAEAEAEFRRCDELLGGDPPSQVMRRRVAAFQEHAPSSDWTGVFALGEK